MKPGEVETSKSGEDIVVFSILRVQIKFRPLRTKGGPDEDDLRLSIEERIALVWPLTVDAWAFKGERVAESRLPRHIVRVLRGRR
jgi:hypothetical protein